MGRYSDIKINTTGGRKFVSNPIYPNIPVSPDDTYIITTAGDRYDTLANTFYGDSNLWWIIASSNTSNRSTLFPTPGTQLRIPSNINLALDEYDRINANR
tara:strand:- start:227 stop:526 length:300 start_codon:yes stop_codon:yes gene_type:complete